MIHQIKSWLPSVVLLAEANLLKYKTDLDSAGIMMFQGQSQGMPDHVGINLKLAVAEIMHKRGLLPVYFMVNRVPAGVKSEIHTDTLKKNVERWHLPLCTNEGCTFWFEEHGVMHMELGNWYGPFPYQKKHAVYNVGETERVHLIVDLEI